MCLGLNVTWIKLQILPSSLYNSVYGKVKKKHVFPSNYESMKNQKLKHVIYTSIQTISHGKL